MADFNIRSDSVDVEQIMRQIRARIREKRGVDYTEQQIQEMATARLERFLDPQGVRSDLLQQFQQAGTVEDKNYTFAENALFDSGKAWVRFSRRLLRPVLKLFFNPKPLIQAVDAHRRTDLHYEVIHNLVLETTRLSIELKNMRMRVESIGSRLDFAERRARALEGIVQYRGITGSVELPAPDTSTDDEASTEPPVPGEAQAAGNGARRRRRRRRGRRGGARGPVSTSGTPLEPGEPSTDVEPAEPGEMDGPSSVSPDEDSSSDQ